MMIIETCPNCGHDLMNVMLCTNPHKHKKECVNCEWTWVGKREEVIRVPFIDNKVNLPCDSCSSDPKNGGNGVCHCILGQQITY